MNILWASDGPTYPSAYGIQTSLVTPRIQQLGHRVTVFSARHTGSSVVVNGVRIVGTIDASGYSAGSMLNMHAERTKADIIITFKDPYVYDPNVMRQLQVPWVSIVPVDTEPLSQANANVLQYASAIISVTRNGTGALQEAGFKPIYVPHGFDAKDFDIVPREDARSKQGLPQDVFVALFVGDNCTYPTRKNIDNIIAAWALFVDKHPDSVLVLHTLLTADRGGVDVQLFLDMYGIPKTSVFVSDQYKYISGFSTGYMSTMYNSADVLLMPSTGEGFGCPVVESQLCGTPVILTDWTAMREMCFLGTKIATLHDVHTPIATGQMEVTPFGAWRFRPTPTAIYEALELAYQHRATGIEREIGRKCAMRYEIDSVVKRYWEPALTHLDRLLVQGDADGLVQGLPGTSTDDSSIPAISPAVKQ